MNFISLLAVKAPHDLWTIIIDWLQGAGINFGWTILLFTLIVKLATTPLDFVVKYTTKKQNLVQKKCAPQVAKLKKKFGNDQKTLKVQTDALYKREGLNMGTGCAIMLVNMLLTCIIFFSLYGTLREVSAYNAIKQYETIEQNYTQTLYDVIKNDDKADLIVTDEDAKKWIEDFEAAQKIVDETPEAEQTNQEYLDAKEYYDNNIDLAEKAVLAAKETIVSTWNDVKESWLWIDNIWVTDSTTLPFPTYNSLKTLANSGGNYYKTYVNKHIDKDMYKTVANILASETERENNGYYILAVAAGLLTFAAQWINELHNKLKNKKANLVASGGESVDPGKSMMLMKFIMPVIMVIFVMSAGASFGIYLIASNLATIAFGEVITLIVNSMTKKQQLEVEASLEKEADRLIKKGKLQG